MMKIDLLRMTLPRNDCGQKNWCDLSIEKIGAQKIIGTFTYQLNSVTYIAQIVIKIYK